MEEETQVSSEIPVIKSVEDVAAPVKVINGDMPEVGKEGKKEEEENTFDGEFIKVEKESLDVKDVSHVADTTSANDDKPSVVQRSSSGSSRELLEAQEKMKELELELERVAAALKHSESENTTLKDEVLLTKEKLEESGKKDEELERSHKKLQEQIVSICSLPTHSLYLMLLNTVNK